MATLSETAITAQKLVKYAVVAVLAIIILRIGWVTIRNWWATTHPEPPPEPTVAFGQLPAIAFPETQSKVQVVLETVTGILPEFPDQGMVFATISQPPNLLALDRAKEQAKKLGFSSGLQALSQENYRWSSFDKLPMTLEMNITNGSFVLEKNWQKDPTILLEKNLPGKEEAIIEAKRFLDQADLLTEDLEEAEAQVTYLKFIGVGFKTAPSLSEADFVRVDLFRAPVEEFSFLTPKRDEGIIFFILSGSRTYYKKIVKAVYRYSLIDYSNLATYPLKPILLAWQELQEGQGFISSVDAGIDEVKVRKIYLAYFDSYQPQKYLQPVFVFEGDNNFRAFVPAVTAEWFEGFEGATTDDLQTPTL